MGVALSHPIFQMHNRKRSFKVYNVDEDGNKVNKGVLNLSAKDIIYIQRSKPDIVWPIEAIRRYGCRGSLFSFESGKKCMTGEGCFCFKTSQASRITALLKKTIRTAVISRPVSATGATAATSVAQTANLSAVDALVAISPTPTSMSSSRYKFEPIEGRLVSDLALTELKATPVAAKPAKPDVCDEYVTPPHDEEHQIKSERQLSDEILNYIDIDMTEVNHRQRLEEADSALSAKAEISSGSEAARSSEDIYVNLDPDDVRSSGRSSLNHPATAPATDKVFTFVTGGKKSAATAAETKKVTNRPPPIEIVNSNFKTPNIHYCPMPVEVCYTEVDSDKTEAIRIMRSKTKPA